MFSNLSAALGGLISDPLCGLTQDDAAALLELSATTISWAQANGYPTPVDEGCLELAGLS